MLSDDEVRAQLDRNELLEWNRLLDMRASAARELENSKTAAQPPRIEFKGFQSETPEMRKAKADKIARGASVKLAACDKSLAALRATAADRVSASALRVPCPILSLRDAFSTGAAELISFAKTAGYARAASVGVVISSQGKPVRDAALGELLSEAVNAAQESSAGAISTDDRIALVVAELQPCEPAGGVLISLRLLDSKNFRVCRAFVAAVPSDASKLDFSRSDRPTAFVVTLADTRNFMAKLGVGEKWAFGVDGFGAGSCLLKAALASRETPALSDAGFLELAAGKPLATKVSMNAFWIAAPEAEKPSSWVVSSRLASADSKPVPVGALSLALVPKKTR